MHRYASLCIPMPLQVLYIKSASHKMSSTSSPSASSSFSSSCTSQVAMEAVVSCCQLKQKNHWDSECIRMLCSPFAIASSWLWSQMLDISNRRKFKAKLPTIWAHEKQRWEESEKRREEKRREEKKRREKKKEEIRSKKRKSGERRSRCAKREKEGPGARKGRKVATHRVFPMMCGSKRSK